MWRSAGMRTVTHFVDGKPWTGGAARQGEVFDPATGQVSSMVDFASASDVDAVVAVAARAARAWRTASLSRRTHVMFAFREILASRAATLAAAITAEHGKVLS